MIYTITFNPALDYVLELDELKVGEINRTSSEDIFVGGKGLNVSRVLNNLGIKSTAIGFTAGFTGNEIKRRLEEQGISTNFIECSLGMTRINIKIRGQEETAINGNGPIITNENVDELLNKINDMIPGDIIVLSGNVPNGIDKKIYSVICEKLKNKNIDFIVDSSKELLLETLKFAPFLIKPNIEELEETLNTKLSSNFDIINGAKQLQKMGAKNVLVSLGDRGAILVDESGKDYHMYAPLIKQVNTVGAGDSMVAGFIAGYIEKNDILNGLKIGVAAGTATASTVDLAGFDEIQNILKEM